MLHEAHFENNIIDSYIFLSIYTYVIFRFYLIFRFMIIKQIKKRAALLFMGVIAMGQLYGHTSFQKHTLNRLEDLVPAVSMGDVLLLDIDDTLIDDNQNALEGTIERTLSQIKQKGVLVLGLTARSGSCAGLTGQQLEKAQIRFSEAIQFERIETAYFEERVAPPVAKNQLFDQNILYASSLDGVASTKGEVLKAFLGFFKLPREEQERWSRPSEEEEARILDPSKVRRIIFVDDLEVNIDAVVKSVVSLGICDEVVGYHFEAAKKPQKRNQKLFCSQAHGDTFPESIEDFTYTGKTLSGGTGGVHLVTSPKGDVFTLKALDGAHFKEELVADALVLASGVHAPSFAIYNHRPSDTTLSDQACKHDLCFYRIARFIESKEDANQEDICEGLRQRFVWDAFFSNWDVVAGKGRNVILSPEGRLYSIDHGGALRYRALGERKEANWDLHTLTDLETMRTLSAHGAGVYASLSDEALAAQAQELYARQKDIMSELVRIHQAIGVEGLEELRDMLSSRFEALYQRFVKQPEQADAASQPAEWLVHRFDASVPHQTSAGVFVYSYINGEPYALLGKRVGHQWWGNFGGKSDPGDDFLAVSASRETLEESMLLIHLSVDHLSRCLSHDLVSEGHRFRMYFSDYEYIPAETFRKKPLYAAPSCMREYTDFIWVKVSSLLDAVLQSKVIEEERTQTIQIEAPVDPEGPSAETTQVILHPPLFHMLRQRPVLRAMSRLIEGQPLRAIHTAGLTETVVNQPIKDFDKNAKRTIKTRWSAVEPASAPQQPAFVLAGYHASGEPTSKRTTFFDNQPQEVNRRIVLDGTQDREALRLATLKKAEALVEFKHKGVSLKQAQTGALTQVFGEPEPAPYQSHKNELLKQRFEGCPYTQTEAHLRLLMKEEYKDPNRVDADRVQETIADNIVRFLRNHSTQKDWNKKSDKGNVYKDETQPNCVHEGEHEHPFVDCMTQAWLEERKPGNATKVFAYHGANPAVGISFDIFTELRRQLCLVGLKDSVLVRGLDSEFARIFNVEEFLREQSLKQKVSKEAINDHKDDYKNKGLSVNAFLFGNDCSSGESTAYYLFKAMSISPPNSHNLIEYLIERLDLKFNKESFERLKDAFGHHQSGRLFQFIFEPEVAQDFLYGARACGPALPGLPGNKEGAYSPLGLIKKCRKGVRCPQAEHFQMRMFAHPVVFQDSAKVRIKPYWANHPGEAVLNTYQKRLKLFVADMVAGFLKSKRSLAHGQVHTADTAQDGLTPVQRLALYIQDGVLGQRDSYMSPKELIAHRISKGSEDDILDIMARYPEVCSSSYVENRDAQGKLHRVDMIELSLKKGYDRVFDALKLLNKDIPFEQRLWRTLEDALFKDDAALLRIFLDKGLLDIHQYSSCFSWKSPLLKQALDSCAARVAHMLIDLGADASFLNASNINMYLKKSLALSPKVSLFLSSLGIASSGIEDLSSEEIREGIGYYCTNLFALDTYAARSDADPDTLKAYVQEYLFYALAYNDLEGLKGLFERYLDKIDMRASPKKLVPHFKTVDLFFWHHALAFAAKQGNLEVLGLLVDFGYGDDLLRYAVGNENTDAVGFLLGKGIDPNQKATLDGQEQFYLRYILNKAYWDKEEKRPVWKEILRLFLVHGANPFLEDEDGYEDTLINKMVYMSSCLAPELLDFVLRHHQIQDVDIPGMLSDLLLSRSWHMDAPLLKVLLDHGADINYADENGNNALIQAVCELHPEHFYYGYGEAGDAACCEDEAPEEDEDDAEEADEAAPQAGEPQQPEAHDAELEDLQERRERILLFLRNGADPNIASKEYSLLDAAVACDDAWLFGMLVHHGADLSTVGRINKNSCQNPAIRAFLGVENDAPYVRKGWEALRNARDTLSEGWAHLQNRWLQRFDDTQCVQEEGVEGLESEVDEAAAAQVPAA